MSYYTMGFDVRKYFLFDDVNIDHNHIITTLCDCDGIDYLDGFNGGKYYLKYDPPLEFVAGLFPHYITRKVHVISMKNVFTTYLVEISNRYAFKLTYRNNTEKDKANIFFKSSVGFCDIKCDISINPFSIDDSYTKIHDNASLIEYLRTHLNAKFIHSNDPQFNRDCNMFRNLQITL